MRKNQHRSNGKSASIGVLGESAFQHGPHYYGDGSTFISDEIVFRRFTHDLKDGPFLVLLILSREVWLTGSLTVEASASSIAKKLRPGRPIGRKKNGKEEVPGERTVERHLQTLRRKRFIRLENKGHLKAGNTYFVEPLLIWSTKWHLLEGIQFSRAAGLSLKYRQNGGTTQKRGENGVGAAKMAGQYRQNGGSHDASAGTRYRQIGVHSRSVSSVECDAPSHCSKNGLSGGVDGPSSEPGGGEERSPNGQDHTPGKKGVGLSADDIRKRELAELREKWAAQDRAEAERKKLRAGDRHGKSNLHAERT
jgi:hypothetical protein